MGFLYRNTFIMNDGDVISSVHLEPSELSEEDIKSCVPEQYPKEIYQHQVMLVGFIDENAETCVFNKLLEVKNNEKA